ncbi:unnamed protein product [Leptidea sinapis]|uniref:acylphosphatase n=1 Tax=Leptidea sinapis TaxID=189913 RepID=A0A5E4QFW6_9NEOP|nr:unnamed protein product [Leptidea sinapis]
MFRLLLVTTIASSINTSFYTVIKLNHSTPTAAITMALRSVDFEVFGKVQGVFFRKYTKEQADKLGLKGWCRNTSRETVEGQLEGPTGKVDAMMQWLKSTGSPSSKIDRAIFSNDKDISDLNYNTFEIRRDN